MGVSDASPVATPSLGTASYIVLGLLAEFGPGTSYDLNRWAERPLGYFWSFPRSQLYAEPQRLAALGLLSETQEMSGRRRRTFSITQAGRETLRTWLDQPAEAPELRDPGLLKLFFIAQARPGSLNTLAGEELARHRARLAEYEALAAEFAVLPPEPSFLTLKMGLLYERASLAFWEEILAGSGAPSDEVLEQEDKIG